MNFLQTVKKQRKPLYYIFLLIIFLQIMVTLVKLEVTPFLLFGMYSEKFYPQESYNGISIYINEEKFNYMGLTDIQKEMVVTPLKRYISYRENNYTDPVIETWNTKLPPLKKSSIVQNILQAGTNSKSDLENFPIWYKVYMESVIGEPIKNLKVYKETVIYSNDSLQTIDSTLLIKI